MEQTCQTHQACKEATEACNSEDATAEATICLADGGEGHRGDKVKPKNIEDMAAALTTVLTAGKTTKMKRPAASMSSEDNPETTIIKRPSTSMSSKDSPK